MAERLLAENPSTVHSAAYPLPQQPLHLGQELLQLWPRESGGAYQQRQDA